MLRNKILDRLVCLICMVSTCHVVVVRSMSNDENASTSTTPCLMISCSFDQHQSPITVHLLRVYSSFATEAPIDAAFGLFYERHPELRRQLDVRLVRKYSARDANAASGEYAGYQLTLQKTIRSLNEDTNTTYLYIVGPDGPQEARNVAMFTPLYNMITFSAFANAVAIGNRFVYPLVFRICMTTVEFGLTQAHMVQMLGFKSIAYVSLDEISDEQLSQGRGAVDATVTDVVAIHVLNRENIDSMARALLEAQPDAILSAFGTWRGSQMVCNLCRRGILNTDIVWIISGLFVTTDWWDRRPEQPAAGWNCTHEDLIKIYNGSIAVDAFIEPHDGQSAAEVARRVDQINNRQLLARFNDERIKYGNRTDDLDIKTPSYYLYDAAVAGLISLHRAAERVERERSKGFLGSLKLYDSPEFEYWSSVLKDEIMKTTFYGATGFVRVNLGDRRHGITQATQFQATSSTTFEWVLVAQLDFTRNINHTWPARLKFATATGETPLVVKRARARARHRTQLAWALAGGIGGLLLVATIFAFYIQRRRLTAQQDVSWLIVDPLSRVSYVTPVAPKLMIAGSRTMSWRARSTQSFTSASGSIAASQHHEGDASQKSSVFGSAKSARNQMPLVWLDNVHQVHARTLATSTALTHATNLSPAQLNRSVFPQARTMHVLQHENVNRFFGIITPQKQHVAAALTPSSSHETDEAVDGNDRQHRYIVPEALFAFLVKGSIRTILRDYSVSLEPEMQMLFLADISNGLLALHDSHIAHCLLHPNNLLLDERYTVKLTDFGMAPFQQPRMLQPIVDAKQQFSVVEDWKLAERLLFRAPELLRQGIPGFAPPATTSKVNVGNDVQSSVVVDLSKCDVYSMAFVFVEVLTRHLPFSKLSAESNSTTTAATTTPDSFFDDNDDFNEGVELLQLINELAAPQSPLDAKRPACPPTRVNTALLDIISSCWREAAEYRPTAAQVSRLLKQVPGYQTGNVMQNLVKRLERYSRNLQVLVDERTELLENEMNKSETLLLELLPRSVMMELKSGRGVEPETFEMVSLYFSDLVSFTVLSARSTPMETVQMLNSLFTLFDSTIAPLDVYKVETIGDAYMVASGVPLRNGHNHCAQIAVTALRLRDALHKQYTIPHLPGETLKIRIGLHCGPCVAGVVGLNMPRYCLFGDTVVLAQRMESTGLAMKIQASSQFYTMTNAHLPNKFKFQKRQATSVSDIELGAVNKDHQQQLNSMTYWLVSESISVVALPTSSVAGPAPVGSTVILSK